jgi:hypothetical protein
MRCINKNGHIQHKRWSDQGFTEVYLDIKYYSNCIPNFNWFDQRIRKFQLFKCSAIIFSAKDIRTHFSPFIMQQYYLLVNILLPVIFNSSNEITSSLTALCVNEWLHYLNDMGIILICSLKFYWKNSHIFLMKTL